MPDEEISFMDIYILNGLSGISGIIDVFESVIWNPQYYGPGSFQLTLQATENNYSMLCEGAYLVRGSDIKASVSSGALSDEFSSFPSGHSAYSMFAIFIFPALADFSSRLEKFKGALLLSASFGGL